MNTLIVPCLGRKTIDNQPQYLLRHPNGKLLIERSIEGIFPELYDKIIFAILKDDSIKYNAKEIIENELADKYSIDICEFDKLTSGPAETVYKTIKEKNIDGSIVVKDSDNYIKLEEQMEGNFIAGLDLNNSVRDVHNLRNKSFLIINEQNNILDIIEKQIKSEIIGLGLYGFKNVQDFVSAYEKLDDMSYPIDSLYLSHIISYLIGYSQRIFHYISSIEYENWGDERLWKDMQRDYTLYFIDLDNIFKTATLSENNKNRLMALQSRGAYFIGYTTHNKEYRNNILQVMEDSGIKFIKVIYDCPYSSVKEIIDTDDLLIQKVLEL